MRRLLLLTASSLVGALVLAPAAFAQDEPDCDDYATQAEAQAAASGGDPFGLDADNDGIACEEDFSSSVSASPTSYAATEEIVHAE